MKEMKFELDYDYSPYDCVEKISEQLNKIGLDIELSDDSDDGIVAFEIIKLKS